MDACSGDDGAWAWFKRVRNYGLSASVTRGSPPATNLVAILQRGDDEPRARVSPIAPKSLPYEVLDRIDAFRAGDEVTG